MAFEFKLLNSANSHETGGWELERRNDFPMPHSYLMESLNPSPVKYQFRYFKQYFYDNQTGTYHSEITHIKSPITFGTFIFDKRLNLVPFPWSMLHTHNSFPSLNNPSPPGGPKES